MAEEPSQKYLTYADHPFEIEEADEELLLRATALITADVQDAKQRWRDAACQIIATKDRRIAELEAKLAAKWISVANAGPEEGVEVLTIDEHGNMSVDYVENFADGPEWRNDSSYPPTHWQLLPDPPVQP